MKGPCSGTACQLEVSARTHQTWKSQRIAALNENHHDSRLKWRHKKRSRKMCASRTDVVDAGECGGWRRGVTRNAEQLAADKAHAVTVDGVRLVHCAGSHHLGPHHDVWTHTPSDMNNMRKAWPMYSRRAHCARAIVEHAQKQTNKTGTQRCADGQHQRCSTNHSDSKSIITTHGRSLQHKTSTGVPTRRWASLTFAMLGRFSRKCFSASECSPITCLEGSATLQCDGIRVANANGRWRNNAHRAPRMMLACMSSSTVRRFLMARDRASF